MPNRRLAVTLLVAVGLWGALTAARDNGSTGLQAQYFTSTDWTGTPAHTGLDREISTRQLSRGWGFVPPDAFSVRWSGYIFVNRSGVHRIATSSDDGSQVFVDGRLVVDNDGTLGLATREASVPLERGSHAIVVQYSQAGGPYELEWEWAYDREPLADVPSWLLSPRSRGYSTLLLFRAIGWLWPPLTVIWIALAGCLVYQLRWWPGRQSYLSGTPLHPRRAAMALAFFVVLTIVQTWPLATSPAHLSRNDNADTMLNEWTLAWVAHQLPQHPLRLFDGNMFYPERNTVALSELLFVQSLMAAPVLWLGASPVLVYNLVLLAGFALTGWAMCLVVARWTGDFAAGLASGAMMAFNAHTLTRLPHLQAQHVEFLPLALLALDALLRRPRWSAALCVSLGFALQSLTSIYLLVFTAIALVVATLARPEDWLGSSFRRLAPKLIAAAALAAIVLAPFLLPYWHLRATGFARSLDEAGFFAAGAQNYLTTPSRFHSLSGVAPALFPGAAAMILTAIAMGSGVAFTDARARMCLAFGAVGVLLSLGPAVAPGYEQLHAALPLLQAIRVTSRFGYLGLVAVAVLGGYGVAELRRRVAASTGWKRAASAAIVAIVAVVALEPLAAPIDYTRFDGISPIYKLPASETDAIVVDLPFPPPESQFRNAPFLLSSTLNWKPLLNGYSGFVPASYVRHYLELNAFPAPTAIAALEAAGVTHVFAHVDQFSPEDVEAIERNPALRLLARDGSVALYRVFFRPRR